MSLHASDSSQHGLWSKRAAFMFAAIGSAVGLGNIWKFPYMVGESGGGAFVLVYLVCIIVIGLPVMMAEITLGQRGRHSPVQTMRRLAKEDGNSPAWQIIGWMGMLAGVMILSFYVVIAGWTVAYLVDSVQGAFEGFDAAAAQIHFEALVSSPKHLIFWHTLMTVLTAWVVMRGVNHGIEKATTILMPSLFALLLLLVGYGALYGDFTRSIEYLFVFDFAQITPQVTLSAIGQAFFSLSIGMGAIMVYGAYLPRKYSIPEAATVVVSADMVVALLMGMALFPVVFSSGLEPSAGPGLIFQTLVLAFDQMPGGWLIGILFFALTMIAAWTSAISLLEPIVSWMVDSRGMRRRTATVLCSSIVWTVGLGTVFSFNIGSDLQLYERTFFDWLDYMTSNLMLPLGGILISLYAGWMVRREIMQKQLGIKHDVLFHGWLWLVRVIVPVSIALVLLHGLGILHNLGIL